MRVAVLLALSLALSLPGALLAASDAPGTALVAADKAAAAAAQAQGEWTAARGYAASGAEMFAPRRVLIADYARGRMDPPIAQRWAAEQAWLSCDGTAGVTAGRWWQPGSRRKGWYAAVWVKLRDGRFKLLLRRTAAQPIKFLTRPGLTGARATCTGQPGLPLSAPEVGADLKLGAARDQTLIWSSSVNPEGAVRLVVSLWDGVRHVPVLADPATRSNPR